MSGDLSYERSGSLMTLEVERIENHDPILPFSRSGTLTIQLWATSSPYYGGYLSGYLLAQAEIGRIRGGRFLSHVRRTVSFSSPPQGTYWIVMVLAEWQGFAYETIDYLRFSRRQTFDPSPFEGAVSLGSGWKYLTWFGFFNDAQYPWVIHEKLGFVYVFGTRTGSVWIYISSIDMGWIWTSSILAPFFYRIGDDSWLYFDTDSTVPLWFYILSTSEWESW